MKIAMIHYRVGETDGVSLEMDKWKLVLEKAGHELVYIAGSCGKCKAYIVPELFYRDEYDARLNQACYEDLGPFTEATLEEALNERAMRVKKQLIKLFIDLDIEMIIPNNLLCLGRSPYIAKGLVEAAIELGIKVIGHHHDFYWERSYYSKPTIPYVRSLLEEYFPPKTLTGMKHVVINTLAQKTLASCKGLKSTVIPNVFDFYMDPWVRDDYNTSYKEAIGLRDSDLVFLQATRVTNRKAIELAIDLVAKLESEPYRGQLVGKKLSNHKIFTKDSQIVLLLVGLHEGIDGYVEKLIEHANNLGVKMLLKPEFVDHERCQKNSRKVYSLWDAYVDCDMITYPSIYEGWGNQFLEGVFAKKPQIVFEYTVFEADIKRFGFEYISLGNDYETRESGLVQIEETKLNDTAMSVVEWLCNEERTSNKVESNFAIAREKLSIKALEILLEELLL